MVLPALDLEVPDPETVGKELGSPAIVSDGRHGGLYPPSRPRLSMSEHGADGVVTIAEDVGLDRHRFPHHRLRREAATVHLG